MNKQEIDNLIDQAKPFIGKDLMVNIGLKKTINLKLYNFKSINILIGIADNEKDFNYPIPTARLVNDNGNVRKPSLIKTIDCFTNNKPLERF